jgi:hypothetical protein
MLSLEKKSKARKNFLFYLTNKGDYNHNYDVLEKNDGHIIPLKRPSEKTSADEYGTCVYCYGFLVKRDMWKHVKSCPLKTEDEDVSGRRVISKSNLLLPMNQEATKHIKKVIGTMNDDQTSLTVRNDSLICKLGGKLLARAGKNKLTRERYASQRMREVARMLKDIRAIDSDITCLSDCIKPTKFEKVVEAVKATAGYDEDGQSYKAPSLALKIGYSMTICAGILESQGLKNNDIQMTADAKNFDKLYRKEWCSEISKEALDTLENARHDKAKTLPLAEDIVTLNKHIAQVAADSR